MAVKVEVFKRTNKGEERVDNIYLDLHSGKLAGLEIEDELDYDMYYVNVVHKRLTMNFQVQKSEYGPCVDKVFDLPKIRAHFDLMEEEYERKKKELEELKQEHLKLERSRLLDRVFETLEIYCGEVGIEVLNTIIDFEAVSAVSVYHSFEYDGYKQTANYILFRNQKGEEKALLLEKDADFWIDRVRSRNGFIEIEGYDVEEIMDEVYPLTSCQTPDSTIEIDEVK